MMSKFNYIFLKQTYVNQLVLFIYNGVAYGSYSDNAGIAKIKIGLPVGSYQLITGIQSSYWYQNIAVYNTLVKF